MGRRLQLQSLLEGLFPQGVTPHVYFQPPENVKMIYPAIVYSRDYGRSLYADNRPYRHTKRYQVVIIDRDPESVIAEAVSELPLTTFERSYSADQLNHDVYSVYF